eukprot:357435-Chlamydomonas_euryale.AAC.6
MSACGVPLRAPSPDPGTKLQSMHMRKAIYRHNPCLPPSFIRQHHPAGQPDCPQQDCHRRRQEPCVEPGEHRAWPRPVASADGEKHPRANWNACFLSIYAARCLQVAELTAGTDVRFFCASKHATTASMMCASALQTFKFNVINENNFTLTVKDEVRA